MKVENNASTSSARVWVEGKSNTNNNSVSWQPKGHLSWHSRDWVKSLWASDYFSRRGLVTKKNMLWEKIYHLSHFSGDREVSSFLIVFTFCLPHSGMGVWRFPSLPLPSNIAPCISCLQVWLKASNSFRAPSTMIINFGGTELWKYDQHLQIHSGWNPANLLGWQQMFLLVLVSHRSQY